MSEAPMFSVYQFFPDGTYEAVLRYVPLEEAAKRAIGLTTTVGARIGTTRRVIITDGGDCVCFEWEFEKGITFPSKEDIKAAGSSPTVMK